MPAYEPVRTKKSAQFLKVLGNIYRLQILYILLGGEKNVTELNAQVRVSQPALSQHLSKLRKEGIVGFRRDQRQIYYYLNNPHILRIMGVVEEAMVNDIMDASAAKQKKPVA